MYKTRFNMHMKLEQHFKKIIGVEKSKNTGLEVQHSIGYGQ